MLFSKKAAALAASVVAALSVASFAQDPETSTGKGQTIVVGGAIDWIEKSDVSALKEGVIQHIEYQVGRKVGAGDEIGFLYSDMAKLTVAKAKLASENKGEIAKAQAQKKLAISQNARIMRLKQKGPGYVSLDEEEKAAAELSVAEALLLSANEAQKIYGADYDLADQALKEHKILAPFPGVIIERMKNPGESVGAREAVVRLGRTDKMKFVGWVPLETAIRIKGNEVVDCRPVVEGSDLAIEQKRFRGKLTAVSREVNTMVASSRGGASGGPEVLVLAEIDNSEDPDHPELELRQGMKAEMTIHLGAPAAKVASTKAPR